MNLPTFTLYINMSVIGVEFATDLELSIFEPIVCTFFYCFAVCSNDDVV